MDRCKASEESGNQLLEGQNSRPTLPGSRCLCAGPRQGLGAKAWASEVIPREKRELATCRQPVEAGILRLKLHREEGWAPGGGEDPLLSATRGEGQKPPMELLSLFILSGSRMPPKKFRGRA